MNEKVYSIYQSEQNKKLIHFELCGITYPDKNYRIIRRNSPMMCIEFVQKGTGFINADSQSYKVCEGDSYFLQTGQNQYYYSDKDDPWTKCWVNICGPLAEKLVDGYNLRHRIYYPGLDIKENIQNIINIAKNNQGDTTSLMICELNNIFCKMYGSVTGSYDKDNIAVKMKRYLDMNADKKFSLDDLCSHISKSESQTIRIFRGEYGITPYAYFMDKKIELAKSMLMGTDLSIKQIAYKLMFSDEYYFSNAFKKRVGVSPGKYKKECNYIDTNGI